MQQCLKRILQLFLIILLFGCDANVGVQEAADTTRAVISITLGGSLNDSAKAIVATQDGGYAVLGYTQSADGDVTLKTNTSFDYWFLKFDANNVLQWQKTYGGTGNDRGVDVVQTTDGGYAILGSSDSTDGDVTGVAGADDFWLLRLDANGAILWEDTYGFSGADLATAMVQATDGGFLVTGVLDVSASQGQGNSAKSVTAKHAGGSYWAVKLDARGQQEWSRFYGGSFTDTPTDVIQTSDNGYIIVGASDSTDVDITNNKGAYDFWILRIDENGTILWQRSFGGSQIDEAWHITDTPDGNYLIVGDTRSTDNDVQKNNGAADVFLIKITPNGDLLWQRNYGGTSFDAARSISNTEDGGFLIAGHSRSANGDLTTNNGQNDAWLLKTDADGTPEWQRSIGGSAVDIVYAATLLNDNRIIAVGETNSADLDIEVNKGFSDMLIVSTAKE